MKRSILVGACLALVACLDGDPPPKVADTIYWWGERLTLAPWDPPAYCDSFRAELRVLSPPRTRSWTATSGRTPVHT
jgi:hypothetical protein